MRQTSLLCLVFSKMKRDQFFFFNTYIYFTTLAAKLQHAQ